MDINKILSEVQDKRDERNTTSLKMKEDLINFFSPLNLNNCIEVGTSNGNTTRILSYLFDNVTTIELQISEINKAQKLNNDRTNIEYLHGDAYKSDWGLDKKYDVAFIDANHFYDFVKQDYENCSALGVKYFVFDDYGLAYNASPCVKPFIDDMVSDGTLEIVKFIGEPAGTQLWKKYNREDALVDWEGVITVEK